MQAYWQKMLLQQLIDTVNVNREISHCLNFAFMLLQIQNHVYRLGNYQYKSYSFGLTTTFYN